MKLLAAADYQPQHDLLIVCGDLIDRGTENLDTLATCLDLQRQGAIFLKGNHEQFAQEALPDLMNARQGAPASEALYNWYHFNGGRTFCDETEHLPAQQLEKILAFLRQLPLYFQSGQFLFTHAGANVRRPLAYNTEDETVWMEEKFPFRPAYPGKILLFGHTPTWILRGTQGKAARKLARIWYDPLYKDKIGLDCGGIFGGRLAALELPSYREFYV